MHHLVETEQLVLTSMSQLDLLLLLTDVGDFLELE